MVMLGFLLSWGRVRPPRFGSGEDSVADGERSPERDESKQGASDDVGVHFKSSWVAGVPPRCCLVAEDFALLTGAFYSP